MKQSLNLSLFAAFCSLRAYMQMALKRWAKRKWSICFGMFITLN